MRTDETRGPRREAAPPHPPPGPLVPGGLRRTATVLVVGCALVVAVLGVLHHGSSSPDALDRALTSELRASWPPPGALTYAVDGLVDPVPILVTVAVLVVIAWLTGQRRLAVLAVLGPFGVAGATTALKPLVARTIHGDNLSFPSGHTGYATALGVVLGLLLVGLVRPARSGPAALLLLVPALVTGAAMAVDQLVLDAHYPSDTLGGFCTAVALVLGLALVLDRLALTSGRRPAGRSRGCRGPRPRP